MADYFPLLSRTIASLGNSTPEQRQIVYERARSVVADQLSAIEPPMDSDAIKRELSLFEACVMRLEHEMSALESIKPPDPPPVSETRKQISARLSDLLAKAAAARAATTQELLTREIEPSSGDEGDQFSKTRTSDALTATRPAVESVPEPVSRRVSRPSSPPLPQVSERRQVVPEPVVATKSEDEPAALPVIADDFKIPDTAVDGDAGGTPAGADGPVMPDPVNPEHKDEDLPEFEGGDEGRLPPDAGPQEPEQAGEETEGGSDQPDSSKALPVVPPAKPSWLLKVQDVWQRKGPDTVSSSEIISGSGAVSVAVEPAPLDPPDPDQAALFPDDGPHSRILVAGEPLQPALSGKVDADFVGPQLPDRPPQSVDIVFSDDATSAKPDAQQSELPFASPLKPPPASEIELQDDGRPRLAQRRKRDRGLFRGIVMGLAFVSVIAAVAGTAWVLRDRPADFEQTATVTRGDLSRKISDRLPSEAVAVAANGSDQGSGGAGLAVAGQRVMVFEEGIEGQPDPVPVQGRVAWALETIRDQTGAGDVAIKAEIKGLSGSLSGANLVIKRNRDIGFPASHLIELAFTTPDNSPAGRVRDIGTPEMRAEEGVRGTSLSGLPVPVTENVFLVGLTNLPDRIEQNRELLRSRNWIVIPMRFANGRRAVLMIEKGLAGDRVLLDAFQAWK